MARRGRPTLAAKSLDEALRAVELGTAPKRPRNEHERQAQSRRRGRKPDPNSPTQRAAELAAYLVHADGISVADASRRAAGAWKVNADNVRRYARLRLSGPTILAQYKGPVRWAPMPPLRTKFVYSITDVATEDFPPI